MAGRPAKSPKQLTVTQQEQIRRMHAEGVAKGVISEQLGITTFQLNRFAKSAGLDFTAARLAEANAVRLEDMKQRRMVLADKLLSDAERIRVRCRTEHSWYERIGERMVLVSLPEPPLPQVASGLSAVATAIKAHMELIGNQDSGTVGHSRSMVTTLFEQMQMAQKSGAFEQVEQVANDLAAANAQEAENAAAKEKAEAEAINRDAGRMRGEDE